MSVSRETYPPETHKKLDLFASLLQQWNSRINLISPRDLPNLWPRHIEDSFQIAAHIPHRAQITDLGSGGGFPGMILAIATGNPVTLIESDQRKCAFLREASRICETKTTVIAKRIETVHIPPADVITARALAPLDKLLSWARPLSKEDGFCLFLKGRKISNELTQALKGWQMIHQSLPSHTDPDGVLLKISDFKRV